MDKAKTTRKFKGISCGIVFTFLLIIYIKYNNELESPSLNSAIRSGGNGVLESLSRKDTTPVLPKSDRIAIGFVSCDKPGTETTSTLAAGMMKSVLISAALNNVSSVTFHAFLESIERKAYFLSKLKEFRHIYPNQILRVDMHFYSVLTVIPAKYHKVMIYTSGWRCSFVRLFMSSSLPNEDAIVYLDTDNLITGNVRKVWELFSDMNERQLIGVAQASEPWDKHFDGIFKGHFADIPHVPPKGLNSGVLLMNLTKMRSYGWRNKMFEIYNNYSKRVPLPCDQRILNILLHFERDLLMQIPCQFNYAHIHCEHEQLCRDAERNTNGIEILHGAGSQYVWEHSSLHEAFRTYRDFNLSYRNVHKGLMIPLREYYKTSKGSSSHCFGSLNRLLFKNYFGAAADIIV